MYQLDEHEAFQAMACYLARHGHGEVGETSADLDIQPSGFNTDGMVWLDWLACVRDVRAAVLGSRLAAAPEALLELNAKLIAAGFATAEDWDDTTPVGRSYAEWRRGETRVRALCHALKWTLWIAFAPPQWFEPSVWALHFGGPSPTFQWPPALNEMCDLTSALLDQLPVEVPDPSALHQDLKESRARYFAAVHAKRQEVASGRAEVAETET